MSEEMKDKEFVCADCKTSFVWTVGEQNFMQKLFADGMVSKINQPKRCPECRAAKKAQRDLASGAGREY